MIGTLKNRSCYVGRVYPRAQRAAKRRNPTSCNLIGNNGPLYCIRCGERSLKLLEVCGCIIVPRNRVAFCRPVSQINQFAAFAAKRPPGIVVPPGEAFALRAGVCLGGFFGRGFVSHDWVRVSIHLRGIVWAGMFSCPLRVVYVVRRAVLCRNEACCPRQTFMSDYAFRLI